MRHIVASLVLILLVSGGAHIALAQQGLPPQGDNGGGPPNPQEMRQRMLDRMKDELGAKDDEWKTLEPKIEKVMTLQRDARSGGRGPGGFGGPMRGGPGGGPGGGPNGDRGGNGGGPGGDQAGDRGPQDRAPQDRTQGERGQDRGPGAQDGGDRPQRPPQDDRPQSATMKAQQELRTTLEDNDAPADKVAAQLKVLRESRTKAKADLATAQKDLQSVVTPRQEAQLVIMGMLE